MSIEPLQGRELFAAQEHHSETEVRIRIRYRSDVTPGARVVTLAFSRWDHHGKNFDALQLATRTLWDVKTDDFDKHSRRSQQFFIEVKLPESLTTYRIMAVAGDRQSRFGWDNAEIRINKPLMLTPAWPRFLAVGDKAQLRIAYAGQPHAGADQPVLGEDRPQRVDLAGVAAVERGQGKQSGLGHGGHADDLGAPLPEESRFGAGRELRTLDADVGALGVQAHAGEPGGPDLLQHVAPQLGAGQPEVVELPRPQHDPLVVHHQRVPVVGDLVPRLGGHRARHQRGGAPGIGGADRLRHGVTVEQSGPPRARRSAQNVLVENKLHRETGPEGCRAIFGAVVGGTIGAREISDNRVTRIESQYGRAIGQSGMTRVMNSSNIGTVNAVSPCCGL